ncbi:hypothetical protein AAVH_01383 [Aphelenchoides avenae]|nr:hypothetical protein AAVH_01383 [Aphelenchus avenae]
MSEEEDASKVTSTWRNLRSHALSSGRSYYEQMRKRTKNVSWLTFGFGFSMFLGIMFFIMGLVWLTNGETESARAWVFFSLGICLILFAMCLLLVRCVLPRQTTRRARSTHRHHRRHHRRRDTPAHTTVWSTQTVSTSGRPQTDAPPSYEEAVGCARASGVVEQLPPPYFGGGQPGGQRAPTPRSASLAAGAARLL